MELRGKTALVTGGAQRIGAALCGALAARGCGVIVHCRRPDSGGSALALKLRRSGVRAWAVAGDFSSRGAAERVVERSVKTAGKIDILINNAAVFSARDLWNSPADKTRSEWEINLLAPMMMIRAFSRQAESGRVINLLDSRIASNQPRGFSYSLSKKSLADLTLMAALSLAPGITVNGVAPGPVLAPTSRRVDREPAGTMPLKNRPAVSDVVKAVIFLLESDAITGQIIYVDGGASLMG